jgi:hypothetical protein
MTDDGVTTPDGWPAQLADPAFVPGESHGIREFLDGCEAAVMGRTTFEPALAAAHRPWPKLDVFVLGSNVPTHPIGRQSSPTATRPGCSRKLRAANRGEDGACPSGRGRSRHAYRPGRGCRLGQTVVGSVTVGVAGVPLSAVIPEPPRSAWIAFQNVVRALSIAVR